MASFEIALNMEFCRSADKSFEAGVEIAAELGYRHIEPMVHSTSGLKSVNALVSTKIPASTASQ